jgi:hypothetical protein
MFMFLDPHENSLKRLASDLEKAKRLGRNLDKKTSRCGCYKRGERMVPCQ